jgi:hypothetical protein
MPTTLNAETTTPIVPMSTKSKGPKQKKRMHLLITTAAFAYNDTNVETDKTKVNRKRNIQQKLYENKLFLNSVKLRMLVTTVCAQKQTRKHKFWWMHWTWPSTRLREMCNSSQWDEVRGSLPHSLNEVIQRKCHFQLYITWCHNKCTAQCKRNSGRLPVRVLNCK